MIIVTATSRVVVGDRISSMRIARRGWQPSLPVEHGFKDTGRLIGLFKFNFSIQQITTYSSDVIISWERYNERSQLHVLIGVKRCTFWLSFSKMRLTQNTFRNQGYLVSLGLSAGARVINGNVYFRGFPLWPTLSWHFRLSSIDRLSVVCLSLSSWTWLGIDLITPGRTCSIVDLKSEGVGNLHNTRVPIVPDDLKSLGRVVLLHLHTNFFIRY